MCWWRKWDVVSRLGCQAVVVGECIYTIREYPLLPRWTNLSVGVPADTGGGGLGAVRILLSLTLVTITVRTSSQSGRRGVRYSAICPIMRDTHFCIFAPCLLALPSLRYIYNYSLSLIGDGSLASTITHNPSGGDNQQVLR